MAFSAITERGSGVEKVLDSSFTGSPSAALTVGKIVFVLVATDNRATVAGATTNHSTLTDTDGHTWNKVYERTSTAGAANDGVNHSLWWAKVTTEIGTGDVFTFTLDGDTTSKVMGFWEATVGAGNTIQLAGSTFLEELATTNPTSIALSGLPSKEYLFLGIISREEENVAWVEAANFTNVFAAEGVTSSTVGVSTTNIVINVGYRILTGTGDTFDVGTIAGASQEIAQALLAFEELAGSTTVSPAVITSVVLLPTPAIQAASKVTPAVIPLVVTLPTPTIDVAGGATTVTPAVIAVVAFLPTPSILAAAKVTPAVVPLAVLLPTPTVVAGAAGVATPVVIAVTVGLPTPSITTDAVVTPAGIALVVMVLTPSVTTPGLVTPAGISLIVTLPTPGTTAGAITFWTPDPVAFVPVGPGDQPPWN